MGRGPGRGFVTIFQENGKAVNYFLRNYVVSSRERVIVELMDFAAPETEDVLSRRKSFKTAAKVWESKQR